MLNWLEKRPGLAAWTQAIGSILAILAAVWIASNQAVTQNVKEERAKIEQEIIVLNAVLNFTEWTQEMSVETKRDLRRMALGEIKGFSTNAQSFVEEAIPIQNIPVHLYGSVNTMSAAFVALDTSRVILSTRETAQIPGIQTNELLKLSDLMEDLSNKVQIHIGNVRHRLAALDSNN